MVYTLLISLLTGLLFGLAPALHVSAESMHENLKEGARGATSDRGSHTVRRVPAPRPSGEVKAPRESGAGITVDARLRKAQSRRSQSPACPEFVV